MQGIYDPTQFTFATFLVDGTTAPLKALIEKVATEKKPRPKVCVVKTTIGAQGKTHLLRAAATAAKTAHTEPPLYIMADQIFTAIQPQACVKASVLCVDDLHMLPPVYDRAMATIIEQRSDNGDGTLLALPQACLPNFNMQCPSTASRLSWGPSVTFDRPSQVLREALINAVLSAANLLLTQEQLEKLAKLIGDAPIRDVLHNVMSFAVQSESSVDTALAVFTPKFQQFDTVRHIPLELIVDVASQIMRKNPKDLLGPRRTKLLATARHFAIAACRKLTALTLDEIGLMFGGRDHSTVLHAINKIKALTTKNPKDLELLNSIIATVKDAVNTGAKT